MYLLKPSLNENDMAIIERGDTAAHDIEAGQYVSWHGKLGKAKAAILQGATLDDTLFDYEEDGTLNDIAGKLKVHTETKNWTCSCGSKDTNYVSLAFTIPAGYRVINCNTYRASYPATQINAKIVDASAFNYSDTSRTINVDVMVTNMYSGSLTYSGSVTVLAVPF